MHLCHRRVKAKLLIDFGLLFCDFLINASNTDIDLMKVVLCVNEHNLAVSSLTLNVGLLELLELLELL
jgi:hypothetical protein